MARQTVRTGTGRVSVSLGAADPRLRRGADASQDVAAQIGRGLRVNRRGQFEVQPGARVTPHRTSLSAQASTLGPANAATLADLESAHDNLVIEHQALRVAHNQLLKSHGELSLKLAELIVTLERAGFLEGGR